LVPIAVRGFMRPPDDPEADAHIAEEVKKHPWVRIPPVITALGAFILFFFAGDMVDFVRPILPEGLN